MEEGTYSTFYWKCIVGKISSRRVEKLRREYNNKGYFAESQYVDGYGNKIEIRHLCASLDAYILDTLEAFNYSTSLSENEIDLAASIVGDLATGIGNYFALPKEGSACNFNNMREIFNDDLLMLNEEDFDKKAKLPNMRATDLLEDIDAYNLCRKLKSEEKYDVL